MASDCTPLPCSRRGVGMPVHSRTPRLGNADSDIVVAGERSPRGHRIGRLCTAILLVIAVARLGFAGIVHARPALAVANDTDRYVPIARNILIGQAYGWNRDRSGELLNTVGYPLFLAGVFGVVGREPADVALAQLMLSGWVALVFNAILTRRLGPIPAFVSGLVLLLDPLSTLWSMTILTESLFAAVLGLGILLLASWAQSPNRWALIAAGTAIGVACLVKPFAMLVAVLCAGSLAIYAGPLELRIGSRFWTATRRVLEFLLPVALLVAPWFWRNAVLWGCPSLSSVDRVTMRDYMAAKVLSEVQGVDLEAAQSRLRAEDPGPCPEQTTKYWKIILANPGIYARLHAAGTVPVLIGTNFDRWLQYLGAEFSLPDLWRPYMDSGWAGLSRVISEEARAFPQGMSLMLGLSGWQVVMYALAFEGALAAWRQRLGGVRWATIVLLLVIAILVLTPGQGGHERFRVPVQPLLAILIGYAVAWGRPRHSLSGRIARSAPPRWPAGDADQG